MATDATLTSALDEERHCSRCGYFDPEVVSGDLRLCEDCYYLYGSCCMEFGSDDLWADRSESPASL